MLNWNVYNLANEWRKDQIAEAMQDRLVRFAAEKHESIITQLSIKILDLMGKKLVQWGSQIQCRTAEWAMTSSKRAI